MSPRTESQPAGWFRRFLRLVLRYRATVLVATLGVTAGMVLNAGSPLIIKYVVDTVIEPGEHGVGAWLIWVMVGFCLVRFGVSYTHRYLTNRLAHSVERDLRTELFAAIQRIDGPQQDKLRTGQVMSRAISDVDLARELLKLIPQTAFNVFTFLASLVIMLVLSPLLALVALLTVPVIGVLALRMRRYLFPAEWAAQQSTADSTEIVENSVSGVRVVKGFAQEQRELKRYAAAASTIYAKSIRIWRLLGRFAPWFNAIPQIGQVAVLVLGGMLVINGRITLGTFVAFTSYLGMMIGPVHELTQVFNQAQKSRAGLTRIFRLLDAKPELTEHPGATELPEDAAGIELDEVVFGYGHRLPVLDRISLSVAPGETLALVGGSGSGKSTAALLVPRFYDVDGGTVRVHGTDVRDLTPASLRAKIGMVFETSVLFSTTLRENIAYGRPEATDAEVRAAARAARAEEFILAMPDGYDTEIGERGLTLSGGQRQRIALARALLTDPRILILDDATSAVDPAVEAEIHATLREVMRGRTTLLIAHRRSTLRLADRIAVLDAGRVLDTGTHAELLDRCARYRELILGEYAEAEVSDTALALPEQASTTTTTTPAEPEVDDEEREMAAKLAVLPPATATHGIDIDDARAADPTFRIRSIIRRFRAGLFWGMVLAAMIAVGVVGVPALIRSGVDDGITRHDSSALQQIGLIGLGLLVATLAAHYGAFRVIGPTGERMVYLLRVKMFAHLQRLGLDFYERESGGAITTRMTSDVTSLTSFLQDGLANVVVNGLMFFGVLGVLLVMDVHLALLVLAVIAVLAVAGELYRRLSKSLYEAVRDQLEAANADFQENVSAVRVAQAYGRQERNIERFGTLANRQFAGQLRTVRYSTGFFSLVDFLADATFAVVMIAGAAWVADGSMTTGAVVAFLLYIGMLFQPLQQSSALLDAYQRAKVGAGRIQELLRTEPSVTDPQQPLPVPELRGEIVLDDLHHSYPGGDGEALAGVTARIAPGETVAVVGKTGAGKSTLMKLVARLYTPTAGRIAVDGTDIHHFTGGDYRARIGLVPQESHLLGSTVGEAIGYGRPSATEAEITAAAHSVGAHHVLTKLPDGYQHRLTEGGGNLSAGQRQLIALARAHLVRPDILLLDEATAALDLATEAAVTRAVDEVVRQPTTLVIAHRLTTAQRADRILVMADGRLVEDGTHEQLLAADGTYASLWSAYTDGDPEPDENKVKVPA